MRSSAAGYVTKVTHAPVLVCVTGGSSRLLGFAATCRVRSSDPSNSYLDCTDWSTEIERTPEDRGIQDLEVESGAALLVGEVHVAILKAFRCEGVITNGAVHDIPGAQRMQFPMFARSVALSHSYSHVVESSDSKSARATYCMRITTVSVRSLMKSPRQFPKRR